MLNNVGSNPTPSNKGLITRIRLRNAKPSPRTSYDELLNNLLNAQLRNKEVDTVLDRLIANNKFKNALMEAIKEEKIEKAPGKKEKK